MKLAPSTKVHDLLDTYPFLLDFLAGYSPKFKILRKKAMRETMGRMATLSMVSAMGEIPLTVLLDDIAVEIKHKTGKEIEIISKQDDGYDREKLDMLKGIIRDLHKGVEFSEVKQRFDRLMSDIDPSLIVTMEEELIREGIPAEEIQRLCDLHVSVFRNALEHQKTVNVPPGHPVQTFMEENRLFSELAREMDALDKKLADSPNEKKLRKLKPDFDAVLSKMAQIDTHYQRKEYQLFPFLEKYGISGPSQVMWGIHDEIRALLKDIRKAVDEQEIETIIEKGPKLTRTVVEMVYKENTILYPMAMENLTEDEWEAIRAGESEIGYAFIKPGEEIEGKAASAFTAPVAGALKGVPSAGLLKLDTGALTLEQVNLLLTHLPVEVSFVDEHDEVRYYSHTPDRIFPRSPGVIGRAVQNCHPPKSMHIVNRILEAFREGTKDSAIFWINMGGKLILIRYYAVRDEKGTYRGTIEVTEDITSIQGITGEQRLLDWDSESI